MKQIESPALVAHRREQAIRLDRVASLHAATSAARKALVDEFGLSDIEVRDRLEQEIRRRLNAACQAEAADGICRPLTISDADKAGWRERCETASRIKPSAAAVWKIPEDMNEKEAAE